MDQKRKVQYPDTAIDSTLSSYNCLGINLIKRSRVQTALINIGKNVFPYFFYCPLRQLTSLFQGKQGAPKERATGSILGCLGVINLFVDSMLHSWQKQPSHYDKKITCMANRKVSAILLTPWVKTGCAAALFVSKRQNDVKQNMQYRKNKSRFERLLFPVYQNNNFGIRFVSSEDIH